MKKIYISGPMTGIKEYNRPAFNAVEKSLRDKGYEVFNPAKIKGLDDWTWEDYMRECIKALPNCTHIYLLKGWKQSRGASLELYIANEINMTVIHENHEL